MSRHGTGSPRQGRDRASGRAGATAVLRAVLAVLAVALLGLAAAGCTGGDGGEADGHGHGEAHDDRHGHEADEAHEAEGEHAPGLVELGPEAAARIRLAVAPVEERVLSGVLSTTGRVDFDQDRLAHVSPRVPGRVHDVEASLGESVRAGQTLAVLDSIELGRAKSELLQARVQLALARRTLEREEGLLADRITSEQAVLEARSAAERALAAYQAAKQELRLLGLTDEQIEATSANHPSAALFPLASPIDGTVVEKHVTLGEVVSPERSLFTVADLSRVWIWIDVYERDLARVHLEDGVAVRVDAFPEQIFEGEVAYVRAQVAPETRTARARIDVPNPEGLLRPGMFATVTVTDPHGAGRGPAPATLVVPAAAVQRDGEQRIVFVPAGDAGELRFERRVVQVGRRAGGLVEIAAGLAPGESVVVEGAFFLKSEAAKERLGGHAH